MALLLILEADVTYLSSNQSIIPQFDFPDDISISILHDATLVQEEDRVLRLQLLEQPFLPLPRQLQLTTPLDITVQDATSE